MLVIGPIGLILIVAAVFFSGVASGGNQRLRSAFDIEAARWERQHGSPYPYAFAELAALANKYNMRTLRRFLINCVLFVLAIVALGWAADQYEAGRASFYSERESNQLPWAILGGFLALVSLVLFVRFFFLGRAPKAPELMRELETTQ